MSMNPGKIVSISTACWIHRRTRLLVSLTPLMIQIEMSNYFIHNISQSTELVVVSTIRIIALFIRNLLISTA
jgi:hypothetical protein